jgi:hypothetical protein
MLLMLGLLFAMALTACEAVLADDNVASSKRDGATANVSVETQARATKQVAEADAALAADIDLDQVYELAGVIQWSDLEGGHFIINRGCDRWSLATDSDELYGKLKDLAGGKAIVWGTVADASVYGHRTVNVRSVFGPDDPRPAIAVPGLPCPGDPAPADVMPLRQGEITLHGDLVWRAGRLWLVTDRGTVALKLLNPDAVAIPDQAAPENGQDAPALSLGIYGVAGMWALADTGLVIEVRDIQEWPFRNVAYDSCGGGKHVFGVADGQMAADGWLIRDGSEWLLRTPSGVVHVHPGFNANDLTAATERLDADALAPDVASAAHRVVVIGPWKTDGVELHMEAERFIRIKTVCDDPKPPRPPILPGEIAALGILVFENGQPFLQTPQGRIVLVTDDAAADALKDVAAHAEQDVEDGDANSTQPVRPVRYILVVGKWQVSASGQLVIAVRYALPWPYPYADAVEPVLAPGVAPVPPSIGAPADPAATVEAILPSGREIETEETGEVEVEDERDDASNVRPGGLIEIKLK